MFRAWLLPNNRRSIIIEASPPDLGPAEVTPDITVYFIDFSGEVESPPFMFELD